MKITDIRIRRIATPQYKSFTNARITGPFLHSGWTFSIIEMFTPHGDGYYGHETDPARVPNERGNLAVPPGTVLGIELD